MPVFFVSDPGPDGVGPGLRSAVTIDIYQRHASPKPDNTAGQNIYRQSHVCPTQFFDVYYDIELAAVAGLGSENQHLCWRLPPRHPGEELETAIRVPGRTSPRPHC